MNVLLLGASGQLGSALQSVQPPDVRLIAASRSDGDLAIDGTVERLVASTSPDLIINAAAYTAVDKAETEEAVAYRLNSQCVGSIGRAAERCGARLFHISTDYVFDGTKGSPYVPDDETTPLGIYGLSKRDGECEALAACRECLVVRTAWLYGEEGGNFVKTMLRLMSVNSEVRVISDQIGSPTYARSLAQGIWSLVHIKSRGILHYTDSGVASWYDFACAIQEEALSLGLLEKAVPILPISTSEYPTPARRPSFSILDKSETWALLGRPANHWRNNLRLMLERMTNA
jgi:dTDP-4-dehydrorhamnose reductase